MSASVPKRVSRGVALLWVTLVLSALGAVLNRLLGVSGQGEFAVVLFLYAICAIFPYKISRGSNATRFIYAVLEVGLFLFLIGTGFADITKVDLILTVALLPVELYIFYCLFSREANEWFAAR